MKPKKAARGQSKLNLLGTTEMAKYIGVTPKALKVMAGRRKIPVMRLGHRTLRFDVRAVEAALGKFNQEAI